jgi:hypothetical protein
MGAHQRKVVARRRALTEREWRQWGEPLLEGVSKVVSENCGAMVKLVAATAGLDDGRW